MLSQGDTTVPSYDQWYNSVSMFFFFFFFSPNSSYFFALERAIPNTYMSPVGVPVFSMLPRTVQRLQMARSLHLSGQNQLEIPVRHCPMRPSVNACKPLLVVFTPGWQNMQLIYSLVRLSSVRIFTCSIHITANCETASSGLRSLLRHLKSKELRKTAETPLLSNISPRFPMRRLGRCRWSMRMFLSP